MTNTSNLPVEALEIEYPLTVLRYELVKGSGGAGRFRGGMGLRRVYRAEAECQLRLDGSRLLTPPWGLSGGHSGGRGVFRFGDGVEPFANGSGKLRAGETVEIITPGAGGYGVASERNPASVERDLADGCINLTPR
jgi:N-methylhydantoinase B